MWLSQIGFWSATLDHAAFVWSGVGTGPNGGEDAGWAAQEDDEEHTGRPEPAPAIGSWLVVEQEGRLDPHRGTDQSS